MTPLQVRDYKSLNTAEFTSNPNQWQFHCSWRWNITRVHQCASKENPSATQINVQYSQYLHGVVHPKMASEVFHWFAFHLFSRRVFISLMPCSVATAITWSKALSRPRSLITSFICSLCKEKRTVLIKHFRQCLHCRAIKITIIGIHKLTCYILILLYIHWNHETWTYVYTQPMLINNYVNLMFFNIYIFIFLIKISMSKHQWVDAQGLENHQTPTEGPCFILNHHHTFILC